MTLCPMGVVGFYDDVGLGTALSGVDLRNYDRDFLPEPLAASLPWFSWQAGGTIGAPGAFFA